MATALHFNQNLIKENKNKQKIKKVFLWKINSSSARIVAFLTSVIPVICV